MSQEDILSSILSELANIKSEIQSLKEEVQGLQSKKQVTVHKRASNLCPTTFKPPRGQLMTCVPDGWEGVSDSNQPSTASILFRHSMEDGTVEMRGYKVGPSGWKRNSKDTGWTCSTPVRVQEVQEVQEQDAVIN